MAKNMKLGLFPNMVLLFFFVFLPLFNFSLVMGHSLYEPNHGEKTRLQTYIVHVKMSEAVDLTITERRERHRSFLPVTALSSKEQRMLYSYKNAINGFAARLTKEEVEAMKEKDGFISALPDQLLSVQTTHSPSFLGLNQESGFWKNSSFGKGVVIGLLDTGIYPNHPSFNDKGMPPPPKKWKGGCDFDATKCNNKLIGARTLNSGAKVMFGSAAEEPIDDEGHGTHTASTAAGSSVKNVAVFGNANGTAVGMAPLAHLAMYKVCYESGCAASDILAGLDTAVEDGVDVLSLSIGGISGPFYRDPIAVGTFRALQKNIFVSCAGGNSGPYDSSLSNEAPWILTVGASTMDRNIIATVKLGNAEEFDGESLYQPKNFTPTLLPLVYPGIDGKTQSKYCEANSLKGINVTGKVVLCFYGGASGRVAKGRVVKKAGGSAMILSNEEEDGFTTIVDAHVLPASHVGFQDGLKIRAYINSTEVPKATIIFKGTELGTKPSPVVASFSSRGPSIPSPGILKPDIIGPGVSVLAAWPFQVDPDESKLFFNIISGTSMATPHLSGIAALLKSSHPDWSPAAIKSAIMTTADVLNNEEKPIVDQTLNPANLFAIGAGHVNPSKANDPGLVYDLQPLDYIGYLCGLGYSDDDVQLVTGFKVKCSNHTIIPEAELNYPSFALKLGGIKTNNRTVTNVGDANSSYVVKISEPEGVKVTVQPDALHFTETNQKLTFSVTFSTGGSAGESSIGQGYLKWVSSKYTVTSPIVTFN